MSATDPLGPRPSRGRVIAGLLVAPPAAGAIVGVAVIFVGLPILTPFLIAFGALLGWPVAIVLGIPTYALLRRWGITSRGLYSAAGLVLGLAAFAVSAGLLAIERGDGAPGYLSVLEIAGGRLGLIFAPLIGTAAGFVFWRIVRPDGGPVCCADGGYDDWDWRTR